uniref:ABC1 atypical kinase-like domain-containing protein n=1 Tax=viral metagenome TaxID=1070528 RepID=A0A6C0LFJ8_9ZZZZ
MLYAILQICFILFYEYFFYAWNKESFVRRVTQELAKKNILYVKVFQAISFNINFIDESLNTELLTFTDCVPYCEEDVDFILLEKIKFIYHLRFDSFAPINAGMISLVYKVTKEDGTFAILKVKRKNVDIKLNAAIDQFKWISYISSLIPFLKRMNIPSVIEKTLMHMKEQTNFLQEIQNTIEMKEKCKHLDYVKVPEIYPDITQQFPDVILMEYIDGKHIREIDEADYEIYSKQVIKYGIVSAFIIGFIHADLHSGNILFIKEEGEKREGVDGHVYKIAPIDFGLVTTIKDSTKKLLMNIMFELFTGDPDISARKTINTLFDPPDLKNNIPHHLYEKFVTLVSTNIKNTIDIKKGVSQIFLYNFFIQFNDFLSNKELKQYNIKINEDFSKIQTAIAMANGISMALCKENFIEFTNSVTNDLLHVSLFVPDE